MNLIELHKWEGFHQRVEESYRDSSSLEQAYQKTEQERLKIFGERLYSNFNSFKAAYYRKVRENLRK